MKQPGVTQSNPWSINPVHLTQVGDDVWVQKFDEVSSSEKAAIIFKLIKRCPSETMNLIKEAVDDSRGDGGDDKEEDEEEEDVEEDEVLEVVMVEDSDGGEEGEGEEGEEDEENDGIIDIGERWRGFRSPWGIREEEIDEPGDVVEGKRVEEEV
ncbi:2278_t:CDS:2 [Entrophospora sp. SA101]|nr:11422_t:CDS:2 [Entrophospora sp. SA101]CAJ0650166.1 2278_t:CDS:2 [Entrophospora sp. SA101]